MNHEMGLFPKNFENVKLGQKQREYRLYDEKRQKINIGDFITFVNTETKEKAVVSVIDMFVFDDFATCYQAFWDEDFANREKTLEEIVLDTYENWWPKELEEKYGCVIIKIALVDHAKQAKSSHSKITTINF